MVIDMRDDRIAFLINSLSDGGAEKVVKLLILYLYNDNINIELICLEKSDIYKIDSNIKVSYLSNFTGKESGIKKLILIPFLAFKLRNYIKKNQINLVQSHLFRASYVNLISKILFRSKHIVQVVNHSIISRYKNNGVVGKVNLFLIKSLYQFSDKIISVSNIVQNDMQIIFNFKNDKEVIYNPFDINKIEKLSQKKINNFIFDNNKKYIISIGRLIKLKRNKDLIYALSKLDDNVELLFIGEGEEKENLILLSKKLNILNRIHFIGWVENPYKYIKQSDILVSTSETESFGNVLVESMICKTAVISTDCGGPSEIINNDQNGILIEVGNIERLVESINSLLLNKELKDIYIENSYLKVKTFDILNIIEQYKKALGV